MNEIKILVFYQLLEPDLKRFVIYLPRSYGPPSKKINFILQERQISFNVLWLQFIAWKRTENMQAKQRWVMGQMKTLKNVVSVLCGCMVMNRPYCIHSQAYSASDLQKHVLRRCIPLIFVGMTKRTMNTCSNINHMKTSQSRGLQI